MCSLNPSSELEVLERQLADWLDRLETSDIAERETIGRYLGRLVGLDFELVIARSLLGMPVVTTRRLAQVIDRFGAASCDGLLDYLAERARAGDLVQAAHQADSAAQRAERSLRLADAERLLGFARQCDPENLAWIQRHGDLALVLGRPKQARAAYLDLQRRGEDGAYVHARIARADAATGQVDAAIDRLEDAAGRIDNGAQADALGLDLARLRGAPPPAHDRPAAAIVTRRRARLAALARPGDFELARAAVGLLTLDQPPVASAAELIETAALARLASIEVGGLDELAAQAVTHLGSPAARSVLASSDVRWLRRAFLHPTV